MSDQTTEQADVTKAMLIRDTAGALMQVIEASGIEKDPDALMRSLGVLVGCIAASTDNPAGAIETMNAIARGVLDESLLEKENG